MPRKLRDSVAVIVGATSGLGRATALAFAHAGTAVVLAGRRKDALDDLADECAHLGGQALAIPTDVTDEAAVRALARQAIETCGRIDIWVNAAAVQLVGRFEELPSDAFRRVVETDLFGIVHGVRAVLPYLREQGSGTIISVAAPESMEGMPLISPYVAAKAGVLGLIDSLRFELADTPGISVCAVIPSALDTPLYSHAGNITGRFARPLPPLLSPEDAARAIVRCATHPRPVVTVGPRISALLLLRMLTPRRYGRLIARWGIEGRLFGQDAPRTSGNLYEPLPGEATVTGGWQIASARRPSLQTSLRVGAVLLGALPVAALGMWGIWLGTRSITRNRSSTTNTMHE